MIEHALRSLLGLVTCCASALAAAAPQEGPSPLPEADRILSDHGCTNCHAAPDSVRERLEPKTAPGLQAVGGRVVPSYAAAFLADPRGVKPWTTMPDVLAHLPEGERSETLEELVHFLASLGGPLPALEPEAVAAGELARGRQLFHSIGCVACHTPQEEPWELDLPLEDLFAASSTTSAEPVSGAQDEPPYIPPGTLAPPELDLRGFLPRKTTVSALTEFLLDPLAVRPSGHMPDLALQAEEARSIAAYLLRGQLDRSGAVARAPGLRTSYFELDRTPPDFAALDPVWTDSQVGFELDRRSRDEQFGFVFEGALEVPVEGEWTFATRSDDGSRLWIGGELVVDNWGDHAPRRIEASRRLRSGSHELRIEFYENGGEQLEVSWRGPGMDAEAPIAADALSHVALAYRPLGTEPFELDPAKAARGAERFVALGCGACHQTGNERVDGEAFAATGAAGLLDLRLVRDGRCVGATDSTSQTRFGFGAAELGALEDLLAVPDALTAPLTPAVRVEHRLARLRCYACHRRDEIGGVHPARREYYLANESAELGDEGRFPPHLTSVGSKLRPGYLSAVLLEGDGVRPYITARMPSFGAEAVADLPELFETVDHGDSVDSGQPERWLMPDEVEAGRRLMGRSGLGCIQCHDFVGVPSLGIRAVDMVRMYERLRPGWFRALLADPKSVGMNSRMAELFTDGRSPAPDILGGAIDAQIDVVWRMLALGDAMPYPEGLVTPDSAYELMPLDGVQVCGVFMRGVSPRTVVVGFPERVHYAFDVQNSRLALAWRGRFFNARGTWQARAGQLESPPTEDVLASAPGMALARLASPADPWPTGTGEAAGFKALGRRIRADNRPVWRYRFGAVEVEEEVAPLIRVGGGWLARRMTLRVPADRPEAARDLWLRLGTGPEAERGEGGEWVIGGTRVRAEATRARSAPAGPLDAGTTEQELLMPVQFTRDSNGDWLAEVEWEVTW